MRLDKLRNAEIAKRNRERLSNPANFPSPPSGNPWSTRIAYQHIQSRDMAFHTSRFFCSNWLVYRRTSWRWARICSEYRILEPLTQSATSVQCLSPVCHTSWRDLVGATDIDSFISTVYPCTFVGIVNRSLGNLREITASIVSYGLVEVDYDISSSLFTTSLSPPVQHLSHHTVCFDVDNHHSACWPW